MRIGRFESPKRIFYGVVEGDQVRVLEGEPFGGIVESGEQVGLAGLRVLAPSTPSKIVAVGLNYRDHIQETRGDVPEPEEPILFIKPNTAAIAPGEAIRMPKDSARVDYEAEVAAVIGKKLYHVTPEQAREGILGFTILNDVTARDIQSKDGQWTRGKGYDTFAPFGPYIDTEFDPTGHRRIQAILNGDVKQDSTTDLMIHDAFALVAFISRCMTLLPGDVVTTGTPSGIGPMADGDTIVIAVEGLGELSNPVVGA